VDFVETVFDRPIETAILIVLVAIVAILAIRRARRSDLP
jgi:hypothetical protein